MVQHNIRYTIATFFPLLVEGRGDSDLLTWALFGGTSSFLLLPLLDEEDDLDVLSRMLYVSQYTTEGPPNRPSLHLSCS